MKNEAKLKGDKNFIIQGVKNSSVDVNNEAKQRKRTNIYAIIGIIVAIATVIVNIIIGWDNIIKFFQK